MPLNDRILDRERSLLLVIDLQEAYRGKIHGEEQVVTAAGRLVEGAALLGVPIVVTEQYPKGLGRTRAEVAHRLPPGAARFEKSSFSAAGAPGLIDHLSAQARGQIVVCGIETHVCVSQSVHDLLGAGYTVHVARDAISARFALEDETGWSKLVGSGAVPTSGEAVLFEWLRDARAPEFKAIHKLVL